MNYIAFKNQEVSAVFDSFPESIRNKLMLLR